MINVQTYTRITQTALLIAVFTLLPGCATQNLSTQKSAGVSVKALNYSAREVSYIAVEESNNSKSGGGGDALNPFGAGGTICCFSIPSKWRADLQVLVEYQMYPEENYRRVLVNVPPYANNEAGDIWLIVHADESVEAVVSNYGPSRAEWPGKIKGYPVPTREYRLILWERDLKRAKEGMKLFEEGLLEPGVSKATKAGYQEEIDYYKKDIRNLESHKP